MTKSVTVSMQDYAAAGEKVSYTERKKAVDYQDILGAALKLCERYKMGTMSEPSFHIKERGGKPAFIEITWTPKQK